MATRDVVSPVNASRLRVEVDLDDYQIRMQEETLLIDKMNMQNQMLAAEGQTEMLQAGMSSGIYYGKPYASGVSIYQQEEIR